MSGNIMVGESDGTYVLKFNGDIRVGLCGSLEAFCQRMLDASDFRGVIVDLAETLAIDSTALGCLARLSLAVQRLQEKIPTLICRSQDVERVLLNMGFDDVFAIVAEAWLPESTRRPRSSPPNATPTSACAISWMAKAVYRATMKVERAVATVHMIS